MGTLWSEKVSSLQRTETKLIAYGPFLELLRAQGRERAENWRLAHVDEVGRRSTIDVKKWFT